MTWSSIIFMIFICTVVWGGFLFCFGKNLRGSPDDGDPVQPSAGLLISVYEAIDI